ncbi:MAG: 2-nitropropane dioxygenase, partial [Candidatus Eremiobacteraeota bacterium]|nr:2-nitropropane dioxygenase [Candidatus Eremiobacteraeota bacterium]
MQAISELGQRGLGWQPGQGDVEVGLPAIQAALLRLDEPFCVVESDRGLGVLRDAQLSLGGGGSQVGAYVPALHPQRLGDPAFCKAHGVDLAYVAGAMANGICSVEIVEAMARAKMLAFFGSAGLPLPQVEAAIDRLQQNLGDLPFGSNLIHSPNEPDLEAGVVDLYLRKGVRRVSASAYLGLTLPLVRYRVSGIHRDAQGNIVVPNKVIAKVSRIEVAGRFFAPPPEKMLRQLVEAGQITAEEAKLAESIPMAEDLTAEADSGGHTDNRPALALVPTMIALRDEMERTHGFKNLRVGAAGGIATPVSACAAFTMGAAYVLTGSIN